MGNINMGIIKTYRRFFWEYLRNPSATGAIARSSSALATLMMTAVDLRPDQRVLELGPGDGVFTRRIVARLNDRRQYVGLEINPHFVAHLQAAFPGLNVIQADAAEFDFAGCVQEASRFDVVISGLPWAGFPESLQHRIFANILPHLRPQAIFGTFAYSGIHLKPAGRRFRCLLEATFEQVAATRTVWMNIPPAFVYVAQNPRTMPAITNDAGHVDSGPAPPLR